MGIMLEYQNDEDLIDPKIDPAFKVVVREKELLLGLLNDLFDYLSLPKALDLEYRETELDGIGFEGKAGRLDVVVKLDIGSLINVEMQIRNHFDILDRLQFYGGKLFINQFKRGMSHASGEILPTFVIGILDFALGDYTALKDQEMVHYFQFADLKNRCELPGNKLNILTIELPKVETFVKQHGRTGLGYWTSFFRHRQRDLALIKEYTMTAQAEALLKKKKDDDDFMRSYKEARAILDDQESMLKTYADNASRIARQEGVEQGREEGREEGRRAMISKMLQSGMTHAQIATIIGVTEEDVRFMAQTCGP